MTPYIDFLSVEPLLTPTAETEVHFYLIGHLERPGQLSIDSTDYTPHFKSFC